jgi:hypothetical protein
MSAGNAAKKAKVEAGGSGSKGGNVIIQFQSAAGEQTGRSGRCPIGGSEAATIDQDRLSFVLHAKRLTMYSSLRDVLKGSVLLMLH